jgi:hypothetical protein
MASLEQVTAELTSEPHYWWGHTAEYGWVVLDRQDARNAGESRHLVRCRDWSLVVVPRQEFGSARFVGYRSYLAAQSTAQAEAAADQLLAMSREFAGRAAGFRVTLADLERQRQEAFWQSIAQEGEENQRRQDAERQAVIAGGWSICLDPQLMLDCLPPSVSIRKLRLFGIACLRRVWDLLTYQDCRRAVLLIERLVEGEAGPEGVHHIREEMGGKWLATRQRRSSGWRGQIRRGFLGAVHRLLQEGDGGPGGAESAELSGLWQIPALARCWAHGRDSRYYDGERAAQANLLREILGDPFRPSVIDPAWLVWNDSTVVRIAQAIDGERRFENLPILADALEDAGCDNKDILGHCREQGTHVRGCWVLDRLLDKK